MYDKFVPGTPDWAKPIITREARRTGMSTQLLSAQIKQESGFNPKAGSVAGAMGISQFIKSTAKAYGLRVDDQVDERLDPEKAIRAQADYMKDLVDQYGTIERALSAYNSGNPERWKDPSFRTHYGSVGETHKYVNNVIAMSRQAVPEPTPTPKQPTFMEKLSGTAKRGLDEMGTMLKSVVNPPKVKSFEPLPTIRPYGPPAPDKLPPAPSAYTVQRGDTLYGIAQKTLGSGNRWKELTGFVGDPKKLPIGVQIGIPK